MSVDLIGTAGFDGRFKRIGQAWERTLGFSREELLSTPFIDFVHPDDRERTLAESAQVFGGSGSVTFTNRYRCRDGSYRRIEWNASVHPEEELVYFVARDITDRKRAEESRLEAESRFRGAVEGSLDAFFVLQSEGPVHKDVWFQHQVIPLSDGVAITIRDITPFKRLEAELREALHRRAIHAEELEEKNRLLR
ncbi:PAS domain S-box protein [Sorangium sp. So ce281]|uniref:PAS domain-containing protein n=1 Tax=unclassified Sorangium TaxID=2621164 RepID=UPI003F630CFF